MWCATFAKPVVTSTKIRGLATKVQLTCLASVLAMLALAWVSMEPAVAAQMYVFEGTITEDVMNSASDAGGRIAASGWQVGQTIRYEFRVDFGASATVRLNNGSLYTYEDTSIYDYFFADLLAGDVLPGVAGGFFHAPEQIAEFNGGINQIDGSSQGGLLAGGSLDELVWITNQELTVANWVPGTMVLAYLRAVDASGNFSEMMVDLELTNVIPNPEPGTFVLLGTGFIGLLGVCWRRQQRTKQT